MALTLGAQVYRGVGFEGVEEPDDDHDSSGWRIRVDPSNHPISIVNFDVLIGAEGKRVTVPGKYSIILWSLEYLSSREGAGKKRPLCQFLGSFLRNEQIWCHL